MNEVEVKILDINQQQLISKLEGLGAQKVLDTQMKSVFYQNSDGKKLRVRTYENSCILTYKDLQKNSDYSVNTEHEVGCDSFQNLECILHGIGFLPYRDSEKRRISYQLGSIRFDFDTYPDIPPFVEVEAMTQEDVLSGVLLLGYTLEDTKTFGEMALRKYYSKD